MKNNQMKIVCPTIIIEVRWDSIAERFELGLKPNPEFFAGEVNWDQYYYEEKKFIEQTSFLSSLEEGEFSSFMKRLSLSQQRESWGVLI